MSIAQQPDLTPSQPAVVNLAPLIDHTLLMLPEDPALAAAALQQLCAEAKEYGFFSVCVRPQHIGLCKSLLTGTTVKVATVIGFPTAKVMLDAEQDHPTVGGVPLAHKLQEIQRAVQDGVDELDWVVDVAGLKADVQAQCEIQQSQTFYDLSQSKAKAGACPLKIIIETDLLNAEEVAYATRCCAAAQVFMVKTCTGMVQGGSGATVDVVSQIRFLLNQLGSLAQIKASGGVKTVGQAQALVEAGATRLGTSSGVALMTQNAVAADAY